MPQVSNLRLELQQGEDRTLLAQWDFVESQGGSSVSSVVNVGDTVNINQGAKYYNGVSIPNWVMNRQWIVYQVRGDRAIINKSPGSSYAIMSPIHVNDITPVQSTQTNTVGNTLSYYEIKWEYTTGNGVYIESGTSNTTNKYNLYNIPSSAIKVRCTVTPVSKTYVVNDKDVPYWLGTSSSVEYLTDVLPPEQLSTPSVQIDKFTLEARLENINDERCDQVEFEVYKENDKFTSGIQPVITARAVYSCSIDAGFKYRVRCRAVNLYENTKIYGPWSNYSQELSTIPSAVTNVKAEVQSNNSIRISWTGNMMAENYVVEYTTNKEYFDSSSEISSVTVENTYAYLTGLEQGKEWYFRIKACNSQGDSAWSEIIYKIIGTKPQPPTTWSLTSSAIVGDKIILYWVHNSEDGSKQTMANIELIINGQASIIEVDTESEEKEEDDRVYSYEVNLSEYQNGAEILWRVRTRGITFEYSDWSIQRTINVYAPPTAQLNVNNNNPLVTRFPLNVSINAGPNTQTALSYHISILAQSTYTTRDQIGNEITINAGEEIYSKVFNITGNTFTHNITPSEVTFENNQSYDIDVIVSMNSGLIGTAHSSFNVEWDESNYEPGGVVSIDTDLLCAYIKPYCLDNEDHLVQSVVLSVYRREFDGSFTMIAEEVSNSGAITITDPHPSLDYARYRIVSRNKNTSVNNYVDLPGIPINEPSIVIQWNERWTQFDYRGSEEMVDQPWSGSMLKLPYNIDVDESFNVDSSLINYIGRKSPVSYYGTQQGVGMKLTTQFPKDDKERLYTLRRLAIWRGNVYIREPSGNGYNANVKVTISSKHNDLTIPVSIDVIRVEGDK